MVCWNLKMEGWIGGEWKILQWIKKIKKNVFWLEKNSFSTFLIRWGAFTNVYALFLFLKLYERVWGNLAVKQQKNGYVVTVYSFELVKLWMAWILSHLSYLFHYTHYPRALLSYTHSVTFVDVLEYFQFICCLAVH